MSRSADPARHTATADEGFTLIEVVVALGITMVVLVSLLPQLIVGIRGTALANDASEAKGVLQGQLEMMRNLPYHVAPSAERRIDVLDTYFPDLTAPSPANVTCGPAAAAAKPSTTWTGYVKSGTSNRCSYEPQAGSFYRKVEVRGTYVLVTDTQFLDSLSRTTAAAPLYRPLVTDPLAGYDSTVVGSDMPVTPQIGVTVTAFYTNQGKLHPVTAYSQISEVVQSPTRIQAVANARAVEVGGMTPAGLPLTMSEGEVNLNGSLSRASSASAGTAAVSVRKSTDDLKGSRVPTQVAPGTVTTTQSSGLAGTLGGGSCSGDYACWGVSLLRAFTVSADGGLPKAVGTTGPVEAQVTGGPALTFTNTVAPDLGLLRSGADELGLDTTAPLVSIPSSTDQVTASACGTSNTGLVTGRGYVQTTSTTVATCAEDAATTVSLFPTGFAPGGVLKLTLVYARAQCGVDRSAGTSSATASYQLKVQVADPTDPSGYFTKTITDGSDALPLLTRAVQGGASPHHLGDYIDSWSLSTPSIAKTTTTASASLAGALKLISEPMRKTATGALDDSSVVSLSLGAVTCDAEDAR